MTSIERAAMAMMAIIATATSTMVTPRSRASQRSGVCGLRIRGCLHDLCSILIQHDTDGGDAARQCRGLSQQAGGAAKSPRVRILNADAGSDQGCLTITRCLRGASHRWQRGAGNREVIAAIDNDRQSSRGATASCARGCPGQTGWRRALRDAAVVELIGNQIIVDQLECIADRDRLRG